MQLDLAIGTNPMTVALRSVAQRAIVLVHQDAVLLERQLLQLRFVGGHAAVASLPGRSGGHGVGGGHSVADVRRQRLANCGAADVAPGEVASGANGSSKKAAHGGRWRNSNCDAD